MYPPVLPHDLGMLETADGSTVYWEESGNPHGIPALYLHGGPGGALRPGYRRRFDPARFRIIGLQHDHGHPVVGQAQRRAVADRAAAHHHYVIFHGFARAELGQDFFVCHRESLA